MTFSEVRCTWKLEIDDGNLEGKESIKRAFFFQGID